MPTNLISFPFRIAANGVVATRLDGDEDYYSEELALLVSTQPGERVLVPNYGLSDPAFASVDRSMLTAQVTTYGPPVQITSIESRFTSDTTEDVVVSFQPLETGEQDTENFDTDTEVFDAQP